MKKLNAIIILLAGTMIHSFTACRKFVEIDAPKNQLTTATVFADSLNADAAITGLYSQIASAGSFGLLAGGMTLYPGLSSDELNISFNDASLAAFYNNNILVTDAKNQSLFLLGYKYIYSTNACIEGIAGSERIPAKVKQQMTGELRALRGWIYFNLVNLYGALPIIITADYNQTKLLSRSSVEQVYGQIISDLKFAEENMSPDAHDWSRAGYYAAAALLSKVYLYTGKYDLAIAETGKVISSGIFSLESNPGNVFLAGSTETIWSILPVVPQQATYEGLYFVPASASATPRYILNQSLYDSFEEGDSRKINWIRTNTISGKSYPYPFKYKVRTTTTTPAEHYVVFRMAELYLIRAEAEANLGNINAAKDDLNFIRNRAGLSNTEASDKSSMLLSVERERRAELFCEWGNRWMDLKRTGRAINVLSPLKPNLTLNSTLYPIPVYELNSNPNLSQNPGY
ncbi:RagB/SusD family nutrient uptake outer membrane protein [Mucilaginibacter conchicola]|uniref:RagB/SusD family nutrient uptake outer membrane protein n=1 Tax=Mucilaginibacter conchicola TaxID=2303333 RepID=A0A372NQA4_9SPHI|nr:RagB/SusD family nutrient uptake outer membrane protein [Mucilaginibacter conchicola]RFZ91102.1 RagB/SusD family nutrient uptake outer membrane protein [Mucilaginibacter conchicola]